MQRWECSIYNGTIKSLVLSILNIIVYYFDYFQLWFPCKSDLLENMNEKY